MNWLSITFLLVLFALIAWLGYKSKRNLRWLRVQIIVDVVFILWSAVNMILLSELWLRGINFVAFILWSAFFYFDRRNYHDYWKPER